MAKNKKRGFFSWLGLGRDEATSQEEKKETSEQQQSDAAQLTDATTPASAETERRTDESAPAEEIANREPFRQPHVDADADQPNSVSEQVEERVETPPAQLKAVTPLSAQTDDVQTTPAATLSEEATATEKASEEHPSEAAVEVSQPTPQLIPDEEAVTEPDSLYLPTEQQTTVLTSGEQTDIDEPAAVLVSETAEQQRPTKEGFFARLKRSLVKTRQNLGSGFIGLFRGKKIDDDLFDELEEQLLIADVGVETTRRIITHLTQQASRKQLRDAEALYGLLKQEMSEILAKVEAPLEVSGKTPFVILMVGVNGVGKTTTIGKLARQYQAEGKSVMLAAGDTFRAAAVEQLQVWGQRNNIPVVAQHTGADSASVIFDAIQAAKARQVDVLIADTAGRLQNKSHLMEELKKITRVMKKLDDQAPHEVMLTIDASTGQNAISQTKLFHEAVGLTGITLTKLDGTAKGGVIFSVADQFGIPIRYIGVGEGIDDLRSFKADDFIEALFAREDNAHDSL
ncbi:signal recognition particle-docking protein FtsY [Erwinia papayae]|uniref:Signal recognition particle receptor FtsY n=1 Tax=Erwinia papayae TaxID=206499 RepID=A0ABV3N5I0_9GAMM